MTPQNTESEPLHDTLPVLQKMVSDATTSTADESLPSPEGAKKKSATRLSLVDRARVFEPEYVLSPVTVAKKKQESRPSLQALLDTSSHRKLENVTNGRRSTYRRHSSLADAIEGVVVCDPPRPGVQTLLDESFHRKMVHVESSPGGKRASYKIGKKAGGAFSLIPANAVIEKPKHFGVGPNMRALLDASQHKNPKSYTVNAEKPIMWRLKTRIAPVDEFGNELPPLPPKEKTFRNVAAPQLKFDPLNFRVRRHPKNKFQMALILKAITNHTYVLKHQNEKTKDRLIDAMEPVELAEGSILHRQGEVSEKDDQMYVVQDGELEVQVDGVTVRTVPAGACINQERLLHRSENRATLRATEESKIFRLDQTTFRAIMQQENQTIQENNDEDVETNKADTQSPVDSALSKLHDSKTADDEVNKIDDFSFEDSPIFRDQQAMRQSVQRNAPSRDDLEMIRVLGEGQYGEVWLVAANLPDMEEPRQEFALKIQQLDDEELEASREAIQREIDVLQQLQHPFIVNLVHTYESEESMDMLLGLIPGGELWEEIHREGDDGNWTSGIGEARARFYAYVLTDTLGFIHSREHIFRDLKPENIMIDQDGYPILVDFGFAKKVKTGDKTFTFCGTPNYVAPEIILNVGHGPSVDHWALGIVLYEMISGDNPFYYDGMEQSALYAAIAEEEPYALQNDHEASPQVRDLIDKLLQKEPEVRIGSQGAGQILDHPWFVGMPEVSEIRAKRIKPEEIGLCSTEIEPPEFDGASSRDETLSFEVASSRDETLSFEVASSRDETLSFEMASSRDETLSFELASDDDDDLSIDLDLDDNTNQTEGEDAYVRDNRKAGLETNPSRRFSAGKFPISPRERSSLSSPTSIRYWGPRRKLVAGYYVQAKSPEERRHSQIRRSVVKDFLASYTGGFDLDDDTEVLDPVKKPDTDFNESCRF